MSDEDRWPHTLDARMRALFANVDTSPDFESRVAARVASLRAGPATSLLAQFERRREIARHGLRHEAWMNAVTSVSVGAAVVAVVWRNGPAVARWVEDGILAATDPVTLIGIGLAACAVGLWPLLRGYLPR